MAMQNWTAKKATRNINEAAQDAKAAKFFAKAANNPALVAAYKRGYSCGDKIFSDTWQERRGLNDKEIELFNAGWAARHYGYEPELAIEEQQVTEAAPQTTEEDKATTQEAKSDKMSNATQIIEVTKLSNKKIPTGYTLKVVYREGSCSDGPWYVEALFNGQEIAHVSNVLIAKRAIGKHVRANAEPVVMPYGFRISEPGDRKFYPMYRGKCFFNKAGETVSFKSHQAAENYIIRESKKIA